MKRLFTERHGATRPRVQEELDNASRNGLLGVVEARISEEWFGRSFPFDCQDGRGNAGTDQTKLKNMMVAYGIISPQEWRLAGKDPADAQVFDLLEFSFEHIAEPNAYEGHSFWGHSHFTYDLEAGRAKFQEEVNRIFERNGIALNLEHGEVVRIAPTGLQEALAETVFKSGDGDLDRLLETSREKFLNRSLDVRRESLEKLWDAWERLKTVEPGRDKKASAKALLDKAAAEPNFRDRIEKEAVELTEIGNKFMIRHTEIDKVPIVDSAHVDYLFHRMFSMIRLLLKASGRGG